VSSFEHIKDRAVFETCTGGYVFAEDSGYFSVGEPRKEGGGLEYTPVRCSFCCVKEKQVLGVDKAIVLCISPTYLVQVSVFRHGSNHLGTPPM